MTAADVMRRARAQGIELWVEGESLRYRAPAGALTTDLRAEISGHKAELAAILRDREAEAGPLSYNQQSLWFVHQLTAGLPSYNLAVALRVVGSVDRPSLQTALSALVRRHPALRARYVLDSLHGTVQWTFGTDADRVLSLRDVGAISDGDLAALVAESYAAPFDLEHGPVFRAVLFSRSSADQVLLLVAHHISCDARSWHVMLEDVGELYGAALACREPRFVTAPGSYRRFTAAQREAVEGVSESGTLDYWRAQLAGLPERPLLQGERPRSPAWTFRGGTHLSAVAPEVAAGLRSLSADQGMPLFRLLLAAFQVALSTISTSEDMTLGVPVSGRLRACDRDTVGYFVNILPLRQRVDATLTLAAHMQRTAAMVSDAMEHQDYPFALLVDRLKVKRDASRHPIFDVMFNYLDHQAARMAVDLVSPRRSPEPLSLGSLRVLPYPLAQQEGQYDLTLEVLDNGEDLWCSFRYGEPCCGVETAKKVTTAWELVLDRMARDPSCRIAELQGLPLVSRPPRPTLAIASTFVADLMQSSTDLLLAKLGLPADVRFAPYNQVLQQLVDRDSLFSGTKDGLNVVLLKIDDWASEATAPAETRRQALEAASADFTRWVRSFMAASRVPLLVLLCPPSEPRASWLDEAEAALRSDLGAIAGVETQSNADLVSTYSVQDVLQPTADAVAHVPYTEEMYAALGTAVARAVYRRRGRPNKVIVLDADETLWGGVVGEVGALGLRIDAHHAALQRWLVEQHGRGILLCLCSKNEERDVEEVFRLRTDMILRRDHLSVVVAGWRPKSEGIRDIAVRLNLGLDTFLFLDDNAIECAEVASRCPEVVVVRFPDRIAEAVPMLRSLWPCDPGATTGEDERRAQFYRSEATRDELKRRSSSYREFIASLNLRTTVSAAVAAELPRLAQLTVRTTQFNLRSVRKTEEELARLLESPAYGLWSVRVADRFGDYGLVGFMLVSWGQEGADVGVFLLSCRALGRGVEHAMLAFLGTRARECGAQHVVLRCVPTERNAPIRVFLASTVGGFRVASEEEPVYRVPADAAGACLFDPDAAVEAPATELETSERAPTSFVPLVPPAALAEIAASLNTARRVLDAVSRSTSAARAPSVGLGSPVRTDAERRIAEVWGEVLKLGSVPADVSFFDLGGKSMLLPFVVAYLHDRHAIDMTLVDLFTHPTVRRLAAFVTSRTGVEQPAAEATAVQERADRRAAARRRQGALREAARRGGENRP